KRGTLICLALTVPPAAVAWMLAPWLMELFGPGFAGAVVPLRVLLTGSLIWGVGVPVGQAFLSVAGGERSLAAIGWLQLIVTIGFAVALVPRFGALGGAVAYASGVSAA